MNSNRSILLVANYHSGVGYAWWLMESFWAKLAEHYNEQFKVILAYPSITAIPAVIYQAPLDAVQQDFSRVNFFAVLGQCRFLLRHRVYVIYFSDKPTWHWRYLLYRLCGVCLIIVHDHTPGMRTPARGIKGFLKRLLHRLPGVSADEAIGATEFVRQRLISVSGMPPARCHAAPNGLPSVASPKPIDLNMVFKIPAGKVVMIMTGRAHRYKGVGFVLESISVMDPAIRERLHFLFVGDGPDLEMFVATSKKLEIFDQCTFPGRRDDIPSLLQGANFAIHASQGEVGYSLSILEYMRAGLPVVVPDNPSVCGAIVHKINGIVYPEGDVRRAASAVEKLVTDESLRRKLGMQAQLSIQQYTLENTHAALIEVFEKCIFCN
jgi:glycosyltransferase involved in cell wall biosynthesis